MRHSRLRTLRLAIVVVIALSVGATTGAAHADEPALDGEAAVPPPASSPEAPVPPPASSPEAPVPPPASSPEAAAPPPAEERSADTERAARLRLTGRFGMLTSHGTAGSTLFAPNLGLGVELPVYSVFEVSARYDASYANQGTPELALRRSVHQVAATADLRARIHPAASLRAGVGGGASLLVATTALRDDSNTASRIEAGLAWIGSFDIHLPESRVGFSFGGSGLWHRQSHDILYFAGISFALD